MLLVLAIFFALFGGPNGSSDDVTSGGPSFFGAGPAVYAGTSGAPAGATPLDDGGSGGPSLFAPIAPPAADGGSGGPSHP